MPVVTSLDSTFDDLLDGLQAASAAAGNASLLTGQREWYMPPLNGWSGTPSDIAGAGQAFDRDALNVAYEQVLGGNPPGTTGEAMVVKLQADYIAAMERAFMTRHMSSVRSRLAAAGRYRGHGHANGVFAGSVALWLTRLLSAAADDPYA